MNIRWQPILLAVVMAGWAGRTGAQTFETVGTRAAGMGGAFVAVADDSSAAYWNPAGFAAGNYFTMVLDRSTVKVNSGGSDGAASGSGLLVSVGMPALGLSYYRLRATILTPGAPLAIAAAQDGRKAIGTDGVRLDTLITHHSGVTLVQSLASGVAVGATVKVVRGVAASTVARDGDRDALLGDASELSGKGTSKVDADIGVMASRGRLKVGMTVRNLTEPEFRTGGETEALALQRQTRAGIAVTIREGWAVAADLDLNRTSAVLLGDVRSFAAGSEGRLGRKAFIRGGLRLNTAGPRRPLIAAGGSYAVMGSLLVDAQVTGGSDRAQRGWGISARFVY